MDFLAKFLHNPNVVDTPEAHVARLTGDLNVGLVDAAIADKHQAIVKKLAGVEEDKGKPEDMDMNKVFSIESSMNPKAYNKGAQAKGLGQITPIVLKEWNNFNPNKKYTSDELMDGNINTKISTWYMNKRIPQLLSHYKIEDTPDNRITAYNAGIGTLVSKKPIPTETQNYIKKYHAHK